MGDTWTLWFSMIRNGLLVYALVILAMTLTFFRKGELPPIVAPLCRWAGLVWVCASLWFLHEVGGLMSKHAVILGILPAIYAFLLPEVVTVCMMMAYLRFGWPEPLRKQYLAEERARLDRALRKSW